MAFVSEDITKCPDCSKLFQEKGERVPRLLPCTHTACTKCLEERLDGSNLVCPSCSFTHVVAQGICDIQENRYILKHLQSISQRCEKHQRDYILFCDEVDCKNLVCSACMKVEHRNHCLKGIEDVTEQHRESLLNRLEKFQVDFQSNRQKLLDIRKIIDEKSAECVDKIKKHTEELLNQLNETSNAHIKKVHQRKREAELEIDKVVREIDDMVGTMDSLRNTAIETNVFHEITTCMNSVRNFAAADLMPLEMFYHYTYETNSQSCIGTLRKSNIAENTRTDPTRRRPGRPALTRAKVEQSRSLVGVPKRSSQNSGGLSGSKATCIPSTIHQADANVVKRELYVSIEPLNLKNVT